MEDGTSLAINDLPDQERKMVEVITDDTVKAEVYRLNAMMDEMDDVPDPT